MMEPNRARQEILERMATMSRAELLGLYILIRWMIFKNKLNRLYSTTGGQLLALALLGVFVFLVWLALL